MFSPENPHIYLYVSNTHYYISASTFRYTATIHAYLCYLYMSPDNVWITSPLSVSHILTVLSQDPDTTFLPSADKATDMTRSLWPDKSNIKQYSIWGGRHDIHSFNIHILCDVVYYVNEIQF